MLNSTRDKKKKKLNPNLCGGGNALRAGGVHAADQINLRHLLCSVASHPLETTDILSSPNSSSSNGNQVEKGKKKRKCCKFIFLRFITYETMTYPSSLPRQACARAATHTAAGSKKPFHSSLSVQQHSKTCLATSSLGTKQDKVTVQSLCNEVLYLISAAHIDTHHTR